MGVVREMDYRHENENSNLGIDKKITDAFIKGSRTKETVEQFELWASMSKERENIIPMIVQYKNDMQLNKEDTNIIKLAA